MKERNLVPRQDRKRQFVPHGIGGKSHEAQEHLAQGRSRGDQAKRMNLGREGNQEVGSKGGRTRNEQISSNGYQAMGRKGGLGAMHNPWGECAAKEGIDIGKSESKTRGSNP